MFLMTCRSFILVKRNQKKAPAFKYSLSALVVSTALTEPLLGIQAPEAMCPRLYFFQIPVRIRRFPSTLKFEGTAQEDKAP